MYVFKFGGTSLGSAERMQHVADIINAHKDRKVVVLSAVSGTTNALLEIADLFTKGKITDIREKCEHLKKTYYNFVDKLFTTDDGLSQGLKIIREKFNQIELLTNQPFYEKANKLIVALGEQISTELFTAYLIEQGHQATLINALDFMYLNENSEPNHEVIGEKLDQVLNQYPTGSLFVTQGYICRNHTGGVDNLKRGGSDYTATLIGAAAKAMEVQIWTDIDGVHNNDPRLVENTMPIAQLSFEEAGELAYFGAKILHPSCIIPAQQSNVPVRIKNTLDPSANGTLITSEKRPDSIKAIAVKDGITAIKIKSTRMVNAYGFLRKIFEVFEKYRTPIDMITTSEIAVSLSIDDPTNIKMIIDELKPFGFIEVDENQSIICIVGDFVSEKRGIVKEIFSSLEDIPVRMISYGGSRNNISLLVDSDHKKEALISLNSGIFHLN